MTKRCIPARAAVALLAFAYVALGSAITTASPQQLQITGVFRRANCHASVCEAGRDPSLAAAAAVAGTIQIQLSGHTDGHLGFEWVRLEALDPRTRKWFCVQRWTSTAQASFAYQYDWNTASWPSVGEDWHCDESSDHAHGEPTVNGWSGLRVAAKDAGGDAANGSPFSIRFNNAPEQLVWSASPEVRKDSRAVTLRWYAAAEADVTEYVVSRTGPDGISSSSVSAAAPGNQGCAIEPGDVRAIRCTDAGFHETGRYFYRVIALRPAMEGGTACPLGTSPRCLRSVPSETRSAGVVVPAAPSKTSGSSAVKQVPSGAPSTASKHDSPAARAASARDRDAGIRFQSIGIPSAERGGNRAPGILAAFALALAAASSFGSRVVRLKRAKR
jgi:hypothetical protein